MISPKLNAFLREMQLWLSKQNVSTIRISEQSFEQQHSRYAKFELRYKVHRTGEYIAKNKSSSRPSHPVLRRARRRVHQRQRNERSRRPVRNCRRRSRSEVACRKLTIRNLSEIFANLVADVGSLSWASTHRSSPAIANASLGNVLS